MLQCERLLKPSGKRGANVNCVKCGRQLEREQTFCETCMAEMRRYPVPMDAAVLLPSQKSRQVTRKSANRRRAVSDQERIHRLRVWVRWLCAALVVLVALVVLLSCVSIRLAQEHARPLPGQNYSTTAPTTTGPG